MKNLLLITCLLFSSCEAKFHFESKPSQTEVGSKVRHKSYGKITMVIIEQAHDKVRVRWMKPDGSFETAWLHLAELNVLQGSEAK